MLLLTKLAEEISRNSSLSMDKAYRSFKGQKPFPQDLGSFITLAEMSAKMDTLLELGSEDEYHDLKDLFAKAFDIVTSLVTGVVKSANDVKAFLRTKKDKADRESKAEKQRELTDAVKKTQDEASALAGKVKERQQAEAAEAAQQAAPIYQVNFSDFDCSL